MSRIRALFLGTPDIARFCLEAMIKDPHFEVVGVVTQPDRPAGRKMQLQPSPVATLVEPLGIPILKPEKVSAPEVLAQIQALHAEVVVVVAFGQILKQSFLDLFPGKVVNVHASLLPRWRGAAPIQRALMNGDTETGVCLQVMVKKLDAGPVLGARKIPLPLEANAFDLYKQCEALGAQLIAVDLMDYLRGNLTAEPQDETQVTIAPKIEKSESEIDWSRDAMSIHNQVRGLVMGPVAQTRRGGKIVKIHKTWPQDSAGVASLRPGQVLSVSEKSLIVQCGKGSLELLELQPESRAKMPCGEYLRGYPVQAGDLFGPTVDNKP
ncbi:MAG: methionyl-tRNA formyltransferase [Bdellovibrionales bacterium]|nr:methionyl-tRNA formyltransferase [Bdellovibrionales bacterium]